MRPTLVAVFSCALQLPYVLALGPAARADDAPLSAKVTCAPASAPGRILCELTIHASSGKLVWADALVVQAPLFARPLRSRVVAQTDALGGASAKLALVASELGRGELQLRVRGVLCQEDQNGQWCSPEVVPVLAVVEVAPVSSPKP